MEPLHILLLGPPDFLWQGESWKIARRLLRALLFYLAIEGAASRQTLRDLFWPEEDDEQKARTNLRVALARLRAELPDADILEVSAHQVSLNLERAVIDAHQFTELSGRPLRTASQLPASSPLPDRFYRQMSQAAELWRSPHFLEGLSLAEDNPGLDHWLSAARQRFEDAYFRVLLRLADNAALTGDHDRAIHWAQAALQIDPWAEDLQAKIIRWMLALGRFSTAAGYAQNLQTHYESEGEKIPPLLGQLISQVRGTGRVRNASVEGWPADMLVQVPLVGRENELKALQDAYRRGGIVLLRGEAGSGKTRLTYEFYRRLQPQPRLLLMHAALSDRTLPFQALIDALRRGIRPQEWQDLPAAWQQALAYLLPEWTRTSPQQLQAESAPSAVLRGRLFEALRGLLAEISAGERLVVVLDSAQWCDEDTLAALVYLIDRRLFTERCLLVITARVEEPLSVLEPILTLQRSAWFTQVSLTNLNLEETAGLARHVLEHGPSDAEVQLLREQTGGNPLFLLESLYAALEYPGAAGNGVSLARLPVGGSLHSLIHTRLATLRPPARQAAAAAAVLGGEFIPAQIESLTQLGADAVASALDELEQAHLIQPAPESAQAAYTFIHGQVREVIRWEEGAARLRLLHLRAAWVLEAQAEEPDRPDELLAQHYEAAGELKQAAGYWLKAGKRARALFSVQAAEAAFQSAGRLALRIQADLPDDFLYQLYTHWGEIAAEQDDSPRMEDLYGRLMRAGEERQSPLLIGGALSGLGEMQARLGLSAQALDSYQRAAHHLRQAGDPAALAQCYNRQGLYLIVLTRYPEAVAVLEKANALADGGDSTGWSEAHNLTAYFLGMAQIQTGWPLRAEETVSLSLDQDRSEGSMYGRLVMALAKFWQGDGVAALENARLGLRIAQNLGSQRLIRYFLVVLARAELLLGRLDAAWKLLEPIAEQSRPFGHDDFSSLGLCLTGDIYRRLGALNEAVQAYRTGIQAEGGKLRIVECQDHLALALADLGCLEEGLQLAEAAYRQASALDLGVFAGPALTSWSYLLARAGRMEEALQRLDEWKRLFHDRHFGSAEIVVDWVRGLAAQERGDLVETGRQIGLAIESARRIGDPWAELQGYRLLKGAGLFDAQAAARVRELLATFDRSGRHTDLRVRVEAYLVGLKTALLSG